MLSNERPEFESQMRLLCAGFNVPANDERIEAYWTGLQQMGLLPFTRLVERLLGPGAPERFPSVGQIWVAHREMRNESRAAAPRPMETTDPNFDKFERFANRVLLSWTIRFGPFPEHDMQSMVEARRRIAGQFRSIALEEDVTAKEYREALEREFRRCAGGRVAA